MLKRLAVVGLVVAALAVAQPTQAAPFLTGGFSFSSSNTGRQTVFPIAPSGDPLGTFIGATRLDFSDTGSANPGTAGSFEVDDFTGDFSVLAGTSGQTKDFTFLGSGNSNYPYPPITGFEVIATALFSFDLELIVIDLQMGTSLVLSGIGTMHMDGFQDTPGTFVFRSSSSPRYWSAAAVRQAASAWRNLPRKLRRLPPKSYPWRSRVCQSAGAGRRSRPHPAGNIPGDHQ